jgi:hypothetical protein
VTQTQSSISPDTGCISSEHAQTQVPYFSTSLPVNMELYCQTEWITRDHWQCLSGEMCGTPTNRGMVEDRWFRNWRSAPFAKLFLTATPSNGNKRKKKFIDCRVCVMDNWKRESRYSCRSGGWLSGRVSSTAHLSQWDLQGRWIIQTSFRRYSQTQNLLHSSVWSMMHEPPQPTTSSPGLRGVTSSGLTVAALLSLPP